MINETSMAPARAGLFYGLAAYTFWGVLPIYFKALLHVSAGEILAHRILWSILLLGALIALRKLGPSVKAAFRDPKVLRILVASAALIAVNWLIYIVAVVSGHVLEASLGYFLNPLFNVLLGVAFLNERLSRLQMVALAIAGSGVAVLAVGAGKGLWISVALAFSFGMYGYLRKIAPVAAVEGLTVETVLLFPFALGWVIWLQATGAGGMGQWSVGTDLLLAAGGVITAVPLLLFTAAAKRLPLSTLGFLQYIAPSLQFLCAILLFNEPLTTAHVICFGLIWAALVLFSVDLLQRLARARRDAAALA